jgi:hypothetical protein
MRKLVFATMLCACALPAYSETTKVTVADYRLTANCAAFKFDEIDNWYAIPLTPDNNNKNNGAAVNIESAWLKALALVNAHSAKSSLLVDLKNNPATPCTLNLNSFPQHNPPVPTIFRKIGDILPYHPQ